MSELDEGSIMDAFMVFEKSTLCCMLIDQIKNHRKREEKIKEIQESWESHSTEAIDQFKNYDTNSYLEIFKQEVER